MANTGRTRRIEICVTEEERALEQAAATALDISLDEFYHRAARESAEGGLVERSRIGLDEAEAERFRDGLEHFMAGMARPAARSSVIRPLPLLKTTVRRRRRARPGRVQRVPLQPRPEHQQDRVHRIPVRDSRCVTPPRVKRRWRQQRLDPLPQPIRHTPTIITAHQVSHRARPVW
jgi:uncharacterized protein (DUF1778 family)